MTELLSGLLLSLAVLTATAGLLRTQWERTRCAYLTFEAVHRRLYGSMSAMAADPRVRLEAGAWGVRGTGICGRARESVELPWLDGTP